jgi:hypothetical protein
MLTHGHRQRTNKHLARQPSKFFLGLASGIGNDSVISAPGRGMKQRVAAHQKDFGEFFVIISHHRRSGCLLGHCKEIVYILDGPECFLPELKFNRGIQLRKTRVKVVLEGIGVREVDGMWLVRVFCNICQMKTECLAKTAEFDFSLVFKAKFKRLLCNLLYIERSIRSRSQGITRNTYLINNLQPRIIL